MTRRTLAAAIAGGIVAALGLTRKTAPKCISCNAAAVFTNLKTKGQQYRILTEPAGGSSNPADYANGVTVTIPAGYWLYRCKRGHIFPVAPETAIEKTGASI